MPRDKSNTHKRILVSAKKEFFQCGFEKASMRKIAKNAGITAGGLYKHFSTKEEMFSSLVEPTLKELYRRNVEITDAALKEISSDGLANFGKASDDGNKENLNFIYKHFDEFQLMFNCSTGTRYENIRHDLVMFEVEGAKKLIDVLKKNGVKVNDFSDEQLHILYSTAFTPLFEIITHAYPYEKALTFMGIMANAMNFGWEIIIKSKI